MNEAVAKFRRGLDIDMAQPDHVLASLDRDRETFDLGYANELYRSLLKPLEETIATKPQLMVVASGALTALPFHLLVSRFPSEGRPNDAGALRQADPSDYRSAEWLIKRHAITVLPSVGSLKALRGPARKQPAQKPMIGFAIQFSTQRVRRKAF